jgi:hypothetical protein
MNCGWQGRSGAANLLQRSALRDASVKGLAAAVRASYNACMLCNDVQFKVAVGVRTCQDKFSAGHYQQLPQLTRHLHAVYCMCYDL